MFMIYYAHCAAYWKYSAFGVQKYFEPVYVNVFFAISGYLLYRKFLSSSIAELPSRKYWGSSERAGTKYPIQTDVTKHLVCYDRVCASEYSTAERMLGCRIYAKNVWWRNILVPFCTSCGGAIYLHLSVIKSKVNMVLFWMFLFCNGVWNTSGGNGLYFI